jgi:hypothetical protein
MVSHRCRLLDVTSDGYGCCLSGPFAIDCCDSFHKMEFCDLLGLDSLFTIRFRDAAYANDRRAGPTTCQGFGQEPGMSSSG